MPTALLAPVVDPPLVGLAAAVVVDRADVVAVVAAADEGAALAAEPIAAGFADDAHALATASIAAIAVATEA